MDASPPGKGPPLTRRAFARALAAGAAAWSGGLADAAPGRESGTAADGDWPAYRRDAALSALSPLKGGFRRPPAVAWSIDLGGPHVPSERILVADVTGDGREEFLALGERSVVCRDAGGRRLWELEDVPSPAVVDVRDFAGDGSRGILLTSSLAGRVETWMVDGRTGKAASLWRNENNFGGHMRIGGLLRGMEGAQVAATASGTAPPEPWGGFVRLVSFAGGVTRPRFHIRRFVEGALYAPLILFADLDADGRAEMVVLSHEEVWSFDPTTGAQKFHARYGPSIRTYMATVAAVRLAPEERHPSLVMINPSIPGLRAVRLDGRERAETLWKVVVGPLEDQYQPAVQIAPGGADLAYDLGGDGRYQLAASVANERGDGRRRLLLFDALTGKRLWEGPDARILSVDDLDGDGRPEVVLQEGTRLRIARWTGSALAEIWSREGAAPLLRALPGEGDLTRTSGGNALLWRESAGSRRFLIRLPDGVRGCELTGTGLEAGPEITAHAALGSRPGGGERVTWDGRAVVTTREGRETYRYVPPAPQTYLPPPPLAGVLDGERRILVRDASGKYLSCSPGGAPGPAVIARPYERFLTHVDPAGAGPLIADMDGDGENELVAVVAGEDGTPFCAVMDGRGRVRRRFDLLEGATLLNRGPTGSLGPGRGRWILLRMAFGTEQRPGRRPLVAAFDGRTGERLWVRDHYGRYGENPVTFAAHLPAAVFDHDGDGADDWVVCSENFYGVISVKDNRDLVPPVTLSDTIPGHWTAYSYPSLGGAADRRVLFHHHAYSLVLVTDLNGHPLWHYGLTRDTGGAWGLMADVDGDGRQEVIHAQPDGMLRCFTQEAGAAPCPRCPPGSAPTAVNRAGRPRWEIDMRGPVSRLVGADVDGDGRWEVLFGDRTGLHALGERGGKPRLLWSVPLGRRVGEPILADVDGDGRAEILAAAEDGRLYCLRPRSG